MKINSIFESISGEVGPVIPQGMWTTFIRTQGCNLNPPCDYCDTPDAQGSGGLEMEIDEILSMCQTRNILITGGEPFFRPDMEILIEELLKSKHIVQIETNGTIPPKAENILDTRNLGFSADIKLPSSGVDLSRYDYILENGKEWWQLTERNCPIDFKFVFQTYFDLSVGLTYIQELENMFNAEMPWAKALVRYVFSPVDAGNGFDELPKMVEYLREQAKMIDRKLMDRVLLSIQIHKVLGLP